MGHLLPFYSLKNQKNQNFEKTKKLAKDIIILHKCTKNYNEVQFLRCRVRQTYFFCHFGPFFALPTCRPPHLTIWKIKTLKKKKKKASRDVIILHSAPKITIIRCMFPERWSVTNILSFWAIFCTFTPISTLKMET